MKILSSVSGDSGCGCLSARGQKRKVAKIAHLIVPQPAPQPLYNSIYILVTYI